MTINSQRPLKLAVVGPTYPYRGGIAHHTTLMVRDLREHHFVEFYSFKSQYPTWIFPGKTDRDPSRNPIQEPCKYLLSPLNPFSWIETARHIRASNPDALILPWWVTFWAPAWFFLTRLVKMGRSTPVIFICHNVLPHERSWWDRPLAQIALSSGDGFIIHSQQDANNLKEIKPQAKIQVTPLPTYEGMGQDLLPKDIARQVLGLDADKPVLLFFGFVRPYKGLDVLLDAMPLILKQVPVTLLVVGEMWTDKEVYLTRISQLGIMNKVVLFDRYVPNEDLGQFFGAADVVVLPYRSATQSAVVQLAFSFDKPVITTNVGGLAEAVIDGTNGLIVQPEDPSALSETIIRFFENKLGPKLASGIASQKTHLSWDQLVSSVEEMVQNREIQMRECG